MNSRGTRSFSVSTRVPVDRAMLEFGVSYEELPLTLDEERRLVLNQPAADVEAVLLILLLALSSA